MLSPQGDSTDYNEDLVVFDFAWQYVDSEYLFERLRGLEELARRALSPSPEVAAQVSLVQRGLRRPFAGIHVRRGDFVSHTGQAIAIERYVRALDALDAGSRRPKAIFVASDGTADELRPLLAALGPGATWIPSPPRRRPEAALRAAVDMFVLAAADSLILTPGSTFGEIAAFLGAVKSVHYA